MNFAVARWFALALPAELKLSSPGRALASAISSLTERAGTDGCSDSTRLTTVTWLTGSEILFRIERHFLDEARIGAVR